MGDAPEQHSDRDDTLFIRNSNKHTSTTHTYAVQYCGPPMATMYWVPRWHN